MPTRRLKNEGSISKRKDGRYDVAVSLPGGRRLRRTCNDEAAAIEARAELLQAAKDGITPDRPTVEEWLNYWLRQKETELRPTTHLHYVSRLRLDMPPTLLRMKLDAVRPMHIQNLYTERRRKGASPATVLLLHRVLHSAFQDAVHLVPLPNNPTDGAKAPHQRFEHRPTLSAEDGLALIEVAERHRLGALVIVAISTGLRLGELLGLRWENVDLDARTISVERSLARVKGKFLPLDPKTEKSSRHGIIPKRAVDALRHRRAVQTSERWAAGDAWQNEHDYVFTTPKGRELYSGDAMRLLRSFLDEAGLPRIRFHDLRHTYATLALQAHVPMKVVQEALGHSSMLITANLYSHVTPGMIEELAAVFDTTFAPR
jgi:integrase